MSVFHSQVKLRLWCYCHRQDTLTLNRLYTTACREEAGMYLFISTVPLTAKKCPQREYSSDPASVTLTGPCHIPTHHLVVETKILPPFKNPKSDLRSAWELVCLLECDELACSHPVLASFLLHGFFSTVQPNPWKEGGGAGAQESVWHNRNNWGSVCKASRREWERNRKQECCYGVHYWKRRLHACDLHSLFSVGYITEGGLGLGMHLHSFILEWDRRRGIWPLASMWPRRGLENSV